MVDLYSSTRFFAHALKIAPSIFATLDLKRCPFLHFADSMDFVLISSVIKLIKHPTKTSFGLVVASNIFLKSSSFRIFDQNEHACRDVINKRSDGFSNPPRETAAVKSPVKSPDVVSASPPLNI